MSNKNKDLRKAEKLATRLANQAEASHQSLMQSFSHDYKSVTEAEIDECLKLTDIALAAVKLSNALKNK